jgi:hypothetical protein
LNVTDIWTLWPTIGITHLALVRALQPSRDKPIAIDRIWSSGDRDWGHKWWFFTPDDIDEVMWDAPDAKWEC